MLPTHAPTDHPAIAKAPDGIDFAECVDLPAGSSHGGVSGQLEAAGLALLWCGIDTFQWHERPSQPLDASSKSALVVSVTFNGTLPEYGQDVTIVYQHNENRSNHTRDRRSTVDRRPWAGAFVVSFSVPRDTEEEL